MSISLSGSIWFWFLRLLALEYTLITLFKVAMPELVVGLTWAGLLVFTFLMITGENKPA